MAKKQWYEIEIKCIKTEPGFSMNVGDSEIVAKVKSKGLAYNVAVEISKIYGDKCYVTIK